MLRWGSLGREAVTSFTQARLPPNLPCLSGGEGKRSVCVALIWQTQSPIQLEPMRLVLAGLTLSRFCRICTGLSDTVSDGVAPAGTGPSGRNAGALMSKQQHIIVAFQHTQKCRAPYNPSLPASASTATSCQSSVAATDGSC